MSTDRYDEATIAAVMKAIYRSSPWNEAEHPIDLLDPRGEAYGHARKTATDALTALADAGLLVPPGGEKTTRIGHWSPHRGYLYECDVDVDNHADDCGGPIDGTFVETTWPDGSRHTTGWTEAPE